MPANGRWDLIHRLKVNTVLVGFSSQSIRCQYALVQYTPKPPLLVHCNVVELCVLMPMISFLVIKNKSPFGEGQKTGENYIFKSFIICTVQYILLR